MINYEKKEKYLTEYSFKQVKIANEIANALIEEYLIEIYRKFFSDINKYIIEPNKLLSLLKKIELLEDCNYKEVIKSLKNSRKEVVECKNGTKEIYRFYRDSDVLVINSEIYYKQMVLKENNKKMTSLLTIEGKKERDRLKKEINEKLKNLQNELYNLIKSDFIE